MTTARDWLDLAKEALPQSIKDAETFYKIGKAAEKSRKELKGKEIADEHLSVFKKDWLSREETRLKKIVKGYEKLNKGIYSWDMPNFDKFENDCRKAKKNPDKLFKAINAFDKALRKHLRDVKTGHAAAKKLKPRIKNLIKHHELQLKVARQLESSFKDIMKVAVIGSYQAEFLIYMLHAKELARLNASALSALRRTQKHLDKITKGAASELQMINAQITYLGSDDFAEQL